jgi:hypothetical protein
MPRITVGTENDATIEIPYEDHGKRDDNPEGVDGAVFEGIKAAIVRERHAYFKDFLDNFYNVDVLAPDRISLAGNPAVRGRAA